MGFIALVRCVLVLRCGLAAVVWYRMQAQALAVQYNYQSNTTHEITQQISRKLLRMYVVTSETC